MFTYLKSQVRFLSLPEIKQCVLISLMKNYEEVLVINITLYILDTNVIHSLVNHSYKSDKLLFITQGPGVLVFLQPHNMHSLILL